MATAATVRAIYRNVLRNVGFAVRHEVAHVKNIRRLLRDDVAACVSHGMPSSSAMTTEQLEERAANTLLLYLSSMHSSMAALRARRPYIVTEREAERDAVVGAIVSGTMERSLPLASELQKQRQEEAAATTPPESLTCAHRVMLNVSSLCYYHLSPYTVMSQRRVGGSDTKVTRRRRMKALQSTMGGGKHKKNRRKAKSAAARDDDEDDDRIGAGLASTTEIASLQVPPGRVRGPRVVRMASSRIHAVEAPPRWDGQQAATTIKSLEERLQEAQLKADRAIEAMRSARDLAERPDSRPKDVAAYDAAMRAWRTAKGDLKSLKRIDAEERVKERLRLAPPAVLTPLVRRAEARAGAWFGAARFARWQRGEFLAP